tara:strand:+ start:44 stop:265 length:222 start_codon:yes stop_codon:yes gene_type:complete
MSEPTPEELSDSITALTNYRERLKKEIIVISQKLRIPTKTIDSALKEHSELEKIDRLIEKLIKQKSNELNQRK